MMMMSPDWLVGLLIFIVGFFIGAAIMEFRSRPLTQENQELRIELIRIREARSADREKLEWISGTQDRMRETFQALAGQTLQDNSDFFMKHTREYLDGALNQIRSDWDYQKSEFQHLINPFKENMVTLGSHVRELEQKREGAYQSLSEQIRQLSLSQSQLSKTTITLAQSLKSPTVRGRWGEFQLRRVVELSGMTRHVSFSEQAGTDGGRPDMIVYLPNAGILPIDSKTPMESYLESLETQDESLRKSKQANHVKMIRSRIHELSLKKYWEQFDASPDFVVMFIPIEPCLGAAFEADPDLLDYAIGKRVLITTPMTLIALLKSVAYGWQQQQITERAKQIAADAQELHKRLFSVLTHFSDLGKCLSKTKDAFNKTVGSLEHRVFPVMRRFEDIPSDGKAFPAADIIEGHMNRPEDISIHSDNNKTNDIPAN